MSGTDLLLPEQMTVRGAGEAVAGALAVHNGEQGEHLRNYYDTFDGLVHAAGRSLVHEDGSLALIDRETGLVQASLLMAPPRSRRSRSAPIPSFWLGCGRPGSGSRPGSARCLTCRWSAAAG